MEELVTAFGAAFASPPQTAAVLRARATAAGLDPANPTIQDLLAAVVAAHACVTALGVPSLSQVRGNAGAAALAAIYCRVSGKPTTPVPQTVAECDQRSTHLSDLFAALPPRPMSHEALAAVSVAAVWACEHGAGPGALIAAAEDLSAGAGHPAIAAVADAVLTLALDT